mgnify:CR=1 FL=1
MPELRTEIDDAPATRRDRIILVIVWFLVSCCGGVVGALIVQAFK